MVWDAHARQVVQEAVEGKINRFRASARLNVSLRTVQRKMKEYRERGEECFEHGNKGKAPSSKVDLDAGAGTGAGPAARPGALGP